MSATSADVDVLVWEVETSNGSGQSTDNKWMDAKTRMTISNLEAVAPPLGRKWSSPWRTVTNQPGADPEGWFTDGLTRKRVWARRHEHPHTSGGSFQSSSSSSNATKALSSESTSSKPVQFSDDASAQKAITDHLRRLDGIAADIAFAQDRASIDTLLQQSKERTSDANALISRLGVSEKATSRAAAIKLGNDLLKISKRIDAACAEAIPRVGLLSRTGNLAGTMDVARRDEEAAAAAARANAEALERQQLMLQRMEQEHKQVFRREVEMTLETIEQRHESILEANKKAAHLSGLMQQLSTMVSVQGEQVKEVVKMTEKSKDDAAKGLAEIQQAEKYQQDGSSCIIC